MTRCQSVAFTGMRSGELQRLTPDDVDLDGGRLHIVSREAFADQDGPLSQGPDSSERSTRAGSLAERARPWLFTAAPSRKYQEGDHWINTKRLSEDLIRVLKKLGIPWGKKDNGFHVHSLRHSFETICVNAGAPQRVVDARLGHQGDRSMAGVDYKLTDEDSQKFIRKVLFGDGKPAADVGNQEEVVS